jgi:hypothetical protein
MLGMEFGSGLAWRAAKRRDIAALVEAEDAALPRAVEAVQARARARPDWATRAAERMLGELAADVRAVWDGFARFCQTELGLPPETVMAGQFTAMLARLEAQRDLLDPAQPNPAAVDEYARTLTEGWRRVLRLEGSSA